MQEFRDAAYGPVPAALYRTLAAYLHAYIFYR